MSEPDFEKYYSLFESFIQQEIQIWKEFHAYWGEGVHYIPTFFVKYEDLMKHKEKTVWSLLCFLLNTNSIDGTLIEKLMQISISTSSQQVYKPWSGKVNADNKSKFSSKLLRLIKSELG